MDDPWANAWGESAKPTIEPHTLWAGSTFKAINDASDLDSSEADIGMPSWTTSAGIQWAEPSEHQASLWGTTLPPKEWAPSPYDNISLGKASAEALDHHDSSSSSEPKETSPPSSPETCPKNIDISIFPLENETTIPQFRSSTPTSPHSSPTPIPDSPDAFGTFETGLVDESDVDPWSHSIASPGSAPIEASAWDPEWRTQSSEVSIEGGSRKIDEWEIAKQQKERQDRHVPPEVLSSILRQFEDLSNELWSEVRKSDQTSLVGANSEQDRQSGMDGIEGLTTIVDRLVPQDLTLPSYNQFSKTFTSKHMGESLRLTRHVAITRMSPMALYLASKGSTAWETSVISRPETIKDDALPPGWRHVEKEKDPISPVVEGKKKASGGLLSFFGRKGGVASPPAEESSRPSSPVRPSSRASIITPVPARASVDSSHSASTHSVAPSATPLPVPALSSSLVISLDHTVPTSTPQTDEHEPTTAVSRFLSRFSRNKTSGSSPRNSLALSPDDLEFLSDIIPSANDEVDEASQLKELSNMIGSSPLPSKLPPPLAPPPRPPPPPRTLSNNTSHVSDHISTIPSTNSDLLSLFNSSENTESLEIPPAFSIPSSYTPSSISSHLTHLPTPALQPSSRSQTPIQLKRSPMAIMTTSPPPLASNANFSILPPPPSSHIQPIIPPPPANVGANTSTLMLSSPLSPNPRPSIYEFESDDFSTFDSPPRDHAPNKFDTSISSVFSDKSLVSESSSAGRNEDFDDFDDFVSSPLRTPSPPRLPAKPVLFGHRSLQQLPQSPLRATSPAKPYPSHPPRKISRAADHQRTMSLLETAAARPGRWPAPASPLPEALPPPNASRSSLDIGIFDGVSMMQDQQAKATAKLETSVSSPATFPNSGLPSRFPKFPTGPTISTTPILHPPRPNNSKPNGSKPPALAPGLPTSPAPATSGGLSAQDLSFFEGL